MNNTRIPLGQFITEYSVRNKDNEDIPVYSVTNSQGFCTEYFGKEVASQDKSTYKIVPYGYFAYNPSRINVGSVDWQRCEDRVIVSPLYNVFSVSDGLDRQFLYYYLRSDIGRQIIKEKASGSVRDNLKLNMLKEMTIPNINLKEQQKCVSILDKLQGLIHARQDELQKLDELIKARFVEMFGDPVLNQKNFPVYRMDEVVDFQGGSQPDKKYFEYEPTEDNIRLIQIRDYKSDKYITYIPKSLAKRFCTTDDIMIGRYGPPIFQILQGIEGSFNVALMKATPKTGNREFIRYFLKQDCLLHYLESMSQRTAGQDGIQMDKLKAYPFPMPPMKLQEEFEHLVKQVDKSKVIVQKALDEAQTLFDSLMQKYFGTADHEGV